VAIRINSEQVYNLGYGIMVITPCSLIDNYKRFGVTYCFDLQELNG